MRKNETVLLEKVQAIPASLQSQYMDAVVDMKDDIEKKFARLRNDVSSMQQSVTTTDSNDVQALMRRLEAIESALTSYDKHLSTFRSGLTDEIGAEVARQNIVIDTQKGLIEKIEERVTSLSSHMATVEATLSGAEPSEKKEEAIKMVNDKINRIVAGLNREKAKRDENSLQCGLRLVKFPAAWLTFGASGFVWDKSTVVIMYLRFRFENECTS